MTRPAPNPSLPHTWKLTLAYDGTDFHGWQVQPGKPTIQGELQAALGRITGETPLPQGSGRTDAGVHALAQVASFALLAPIPAENLLRALNRTLPQSIRISTAQIMPDTFHARHAAVAKTYEYRIFRGKICPPFLARYVYACPWPLAVGAMQQAAAAFLGEHDFTSFAASDPDLSTRNAPPPQPEPETEPVPEFAPVSAPHDEFAALKSAVRTVSLSAWQQRQTADGDLLVYHVRGSGFLHHMVRNLVGTMLDVGRGHLRAGQMAEILAARQRSAAGPTAPGRGLFLHSVEYPAGDD